MDPDIAKGLLPAIATVVAALLVGFFGTILSRRYSRERDRQDKESQWRQHAIELTKLDLERKFKKQELSKIDEKIRPSILDFLANYRDLQELGQSTPKELYEKIKQQRISTSNSADNPTEKTN